MKDSLDDLKKKVLDEVVRTSRNYMLREQIRADLQQMISNQISSGNISSAEDVKEFIQAMKAAIAFLETVSFENWKFISGKER